MATAYALNVITDMTRVNKPFCWYSIVLLVYDDFHLKLYGMQIGTILVENRFKKLC